MSDSGNYSFVNVGSSHANIAIIDPIVELFGLWTFLLAPAKPLEVKTATGLSKIWSDLSNRFVQIGQPGRDTPPLTKPLLEHLREIMDACATFILRRDV